jgi:hypothetical protein
MKQKLYQNLVPESLRERIYEADVRRYQLEQYHQRLKIEEAHLQSELSPAYIANLRIVADRNALLRKLLKNGTVAEIGAGSGDFSKNILLITDPRRVSLIDTWPEDMPSDEAIDVVARKFGKEINDGQLALERGNPLSVLAKHDDATFDWVYIGSEPSHEVTASLLEICRLKVKQDGVIAGNNYTTCNYVDQVRYGVIEAVHGFCKKHKWEMIHLTHESHRRLSYALRRIR